MDDPRGQGGGFACFACGQYIRTDQPAGARVVCVACGVGQNRPAGPGASTAGRVPSGAGRGPSTSPSLPGWSGRTSSSSPSPPAVPVGPSPRPAPSAAAATRPRPPTPARGGAMLVIGMILGSALTLVVLKVVDRWAGPAASGPGPVAIAEPEPREPSRPSVARPRPRPPSPPPPPPLEPEIPRVDDPEDRPGPIGESVPRPLPAPEPARTPVVEVPTPRVEPDVRALYPRTAAEIRATIRSILEAPDEPGQPAQESAALRRLRAYRYLAGLPYAEVRLDAGLNAGAAKAALICERLGYLSHTPPNPGLPDDLYRAASQAAGKSNLSFRRPPESLAAAVDGWMGDSDDENIDRLGHRRWCLNPSMRNTGFGRSGEYSAMWAFDALDRPFDGYRFVAHPAPGFMPSAFFDARDAWSVTLNPLEYRAPRKDQVVVSVFPFEGDEPRRDRALRLDYFNVENSGFAVPNCIIFRPRPVSTDDGRRYRVEIRGLERADGAPAGLDYVVEFIR